MAKQNVKPEVQDRKKIMSALELFESATIQMGKNHIDVTRVPGGYLYNDQYVYMSEEIIEDLK